MALAIAARGKIASPKAILVDLFHREEVISEHCQIDFFVTYLLFHCGKIVVHSRVFDIKVSSLSLKETHDVTDQSKSVFCIPVGKIEAPSYHHIVKLVGICDILHTLNELLPKGGIQMKLLHEISSHLRSI